MLTRMIKGGKRGSGGVGGSGLALAGLVSLLSFSLAGCSTPLWQSSRSETSPGMRQSPGEVARLLRNVTYYKLMGQPELGLRELEQAQRANPDNLKLANALGQVYEELGNFAAARQVYQAALNRQGPHAVLANNLGFACYQEGRWQEAEAHYRQSLALDPRNAAARNNLGLLYCRLDRQDEARRLWQEAEGKAAADAMLNQALAALDKTGPTVLAQKPAVPEPAMARLTPSPPARDPVPAPAVTPKAPAPPPLASAPAPAPIPVAARPRESARPQAAAPKPAPPAAPAAKAHTPAATVAHLAKPSPPVATPTPQRQKARKPAASAPSPEIARQPAVVPQPVPAAPTLAAGPAASGAPSYLTCEELMATAIDVRNGTWTRQLARQTRARLSQEGFRVDNIGNHIDFGVTQTTIYYRPEAARVARAIGQAFFPGAPLVPSADLKNDIDVKILLGADLQAKPQLMANLAGDR